MAETFSYKMKVKELDEGAKYSLLELSGLTGLGQQTIQGLIQEGKLHPEKQEGQETIKGSEFLEWAQSVDNTIEVQKNN